MPYIYSAEGKQIPLTLSPDDIGVRFDNAANADSALRAMRSGEAENTGHTAPRGFERVLLLHEPGAAGTSSATARSALPRNASDAVERIVPVFTEPGSGLRMVATREIAVRFKSGVTARQHDRLLQARGLTVIRKNEFVRAQFIVEPAMSIDETVILDTANSLNNCPEVAYATPNFISEHHRNFIPNDPLLSRQWHLSNPGLNGALTGEDVRAYDAWNVTRGGSRQVIIAIVDDGVDITHPDLRANIWINPDKNAKDKNGRNFYNNNHDPGPRYFTPPYDRLQGNDIHGTPCAGVAAACGNNKTGVAGIAYRCRILPVKIFGGSSLASNERVADAIRYAGSKAQVISCSWAGPANADLESAVSDVAVGGRRGRGSLIFCATGNDGKSRISYPAKYAGAIAIGASNDLGRRSDYSNYGPGISFVAPSNDIGRGGITTTDVSIPNRGYAPGSDYTDHFGGTSSATPLAAGIGALVLSVRPTLTRDEVFAILSKSADQIDPVGGNYKGGFSRHYGHGRLNAYEAVLLARGPATSAARTVGGGAKTKPAKPKIPKKKPAVPKASSRRKKPVQPPAVTEEKPSEPN